MRKIFALLFVKITVIIATLCPLSSTLAQADEFNYSTTVGLVLQVEGGGHIFQRPDYDEPRNFFIIIYGIVGKYATQMQPQHAGLALDISSLPVEEKILLINHEATKLLLLGDHWIGDGQEFSIMDSGDYHRLKTLFAETRVHRGTPTKHSHLDGYTQSIHKIWRDAPEEFYREFHFPNANPMPTIVSTSAGLEISKAAQDTGVEQTHPGNEKQTYPQVQKKEREQHHGEKQNPASIATETAVLTRNITPEQSPQQKIQDHSIQHEKTIAVKLWGLILVVVALSLAGYCLRQTK